MIIGVLLDGPFVESFPLISGFESPETFLGPSESLILVFNCQIHDGSNLGFLCYVCKCMLLLLL